MNWLKQHVTGSVGIICSIALTVVVCLVLWPLRSVTKSAADSAMRINRALKGEHANGDDGILYRTNLLLANADAAMNAVKQTAETANRISKAQEPKTNQLTDESVATLRASKEAIVKLGATVDEAKTAVTALAALVDGTNKLVNGDGGTLPTLNAQIAKGGSAIDALAGKDGLIPAATQSIKDTDAGVLVVTQRLPDMLDTFGKTNEHVESATGHIDKTLGYAESWAAPHKTSLVGKILGRVVGAIAGPAAEAFVTHFFPAKVVIGNTVRTQQ